MMNDKIWVMSKDFDEQLFVDEKTGMLYKLTRDSNGLVVLSDTVCHSLQELIKV